MRLVLACLATTAVLGPLGWMWLSSLVPSTYSVMDMGYVDTGGGPPLVGVQGGHTHAAGVDLVDHDHTATSTARSVPDLVVDPARQADVVVELVAEQGRFTLASGRTVDGYTLNGTSPGPTIRATQGDLVEVRLRNESVPAGMTLHWHGVDVPNAEDGVAGVTQDAVAVGQQHTYRFVAEDAGTYWYHSHQVSHEQVQRGLFGSLVVGPAGDPVGQAAAVDVVAVSHLYRGARTVNGSEGEIREDAAAGDLARVRVVNTDNGPIEVWAGTPYQVLAVDGTDVNEPTEVTGEAVAVTAGGRIDLGVVVPAGGVRVHVGAPSTSLVLGPAGSDPPRTPAPSGEVDLLDYGTPADAGVRPGRPGPASSTTPSAVVPASSTAGPDCGGPSTATCSRTCRCSWSARATSR